MAQFQCTKMSAFTVNSKIYFMHIVHLTKLLFKYSIAQTDS